jgi:hypothetical protein
VNANDVFYAFTATSNSIITINLTNIIGNGIQWGFYNLQVHAGCPTATNCVTTYAEYTYNIPPPISFEANAGQTYVIVLDGWNVNNFGTFSTCYAYTISITQSSIPINNGCTNDGFSAGLSGWYGSQGLVSVGAVGALIPNYFSNSSVIAPPRHTVQPNFTDPCVGSIVSPLGGNLLRLGRDVINREGNQIKKKLTVTQNSTSFTYAFMPVLQDPNHLPREQPFFEAIVFAPNGTIIQCSRYIVAAAQGLAGYINSGSCNGVIYRPWSTVNVDLTDWIGQTVTIQFTSGGCSQSAHWGYVYLDYRCEQSLIFDPNYIVCIGQCVTLAQPQGYAQYVWQNGSPIVCPTSNTNHWLNVISQNGCARTFTFPIQVVQAPMVEIVE